MNRENIKDAKAYLLNQYQGCLPDGLFIIFKVDVQMRHEFELNYDEARVVLGEVAEENPEDQTLQNILAHMHMQITCNEVTDAVLMLAKYRREIIPGVVRFICEQKNCVTGDAYEILQSLQDIMVSAQRAKENVQVACDNHMELSRRLNPLPPDQS